MIYERFGYIIRDQLCPKLLFNKFRLAGMETGRPAHGDVFGAEEEELVLFHDMGHVVVSAVAAVTNINIGDGN